MRVVIADDEMLLREGVARLLLEAGFDVVGTAGDAAALERLSDAQHMLATQRFFIVGLPKIIHGEGGAHDRSDDTGIDQTRDFDQLNLVWFDDEEGVTHSRLAEPFGISCNGH